MKFLANENFPSIAVEALRQAGFDVAWIRTESPGAIDQKVLARGIAENRVLLTFDKDFGELAFRSYKAGETGIVLFRIPPHSPQRVADLVVEVLRSRDDWSGNFFVVEPARLRIRPLPVRPNENP